MYFGPTNFKSTASTATSTKPTCLPAGVPAPDAGRDRVRGERVQGCASAGRSGAHGASPGACGVGQRAVHAPRDVHHSAGFRAAAEHLSVRSGRGRQRGAEAESEAAVDKRDLYQSGRQYKERLLFTFLRERLFYLRSEWYVYAWYRMLKTGRKTGGRTDRQQRQAGR